MAATRTTRQRLVRLAAPAAAVIAVVLILRGIDLRHAAEAIRDADLRWVGLAVVLTVLSAASGAYTWGMLLRAEAPVSWGELAVWSGRAAVAGQLVPGGAGGDAVRLVAGRRAAGLGAGAAAAMVARLCGATGIALWGAAGAVLLRDQVGPACVAAAVGLAACCVVSFAGVVASEGVVAWMGRRRVAAVGRVGERCMPLAAAMGVYRRRPGLLVQCSLMGTAGWGVNLAALVCLGHAVGVLTGWQTFSVALPVSLVATLLPLSANGMGVREGILVGLLASAGVATGAAAALSILVDLQLVPVVLVGALVGMRAPRHGAAGAGAADAATTPALPDQGLPGAGAVVAAATVAV